MPFPSVHCDAIHSAISGFARASLGAPTRKNDILRSMIILAALASSIPSHAHHAPDHYGCFPVENGLWICVDPPFCDSPRVYDPATRQCTLPPPKPAVEPQCRLLVRYAAAKPAQATLDEPARGCDRAGLELALAALLARLLGAPLP